MGRVFSLSLRGSEATTEMTARAAELDIVSFKRGKRDEETQGCLSGLGETGLPPVMQHRGALILLFKGEV